MQCKQRKYNNELWNLGAPSTVNHLEVVRGDTTEPLREVKARGLAETFLIRRKKYTGSK